ncbi:SDR family NAD(P)-dependent oxidoreductase [Cohnella hongkongensis]|uniref:SDR family NAD(P)-dependent oxidoreductase n=1 Tax=Cohnella hongkongensis TaxID=178337 RepID=A0ABV9FF32_9BACL
MGDFAGKRVVVTGGAMGIGRGIVEAFAEAGATVVFADRNGSAGEETAKAIASSSCGGEVEFIQADLSNPTQMREFIDKAVGLLGYADVLVNNVGVNYRSGGILSHTEADFHASYQTNVMSCVRCVQGFLPGMMDRGRGAVVSVSSTMALGAPGFAAYAWSKGSIDTLTRTLALEYAASGIRFNAVAPGLIDTPATRPWIERQPHPADAKGVPMRTVGTPLDIANAVLFLGSEKAAYITGQVLYVDGGLSVGE